MALPIHLKKHRHQQPAHQGFLGRPTPQDKILHTSKRLGVNLEEQQGTTINVFDTVLCPVGTTDRQTLNFFQQTTNKSRNFSNMQQGFLNVGESIGIGWVSLSFGLLTASDLTSNATQYAAGQAGLGSWNHGFPGLSNALINLSLGNDTVLKDYMISETIPSLNPDMTGITFADSATVPSPTTMIPMGSSLIHLETIHTITPNLPFKFTVELPPLATAVGIFFMQAVLGRAGSIFSARGTM